MGCRAGRRARGAGTGSAPRTGYQAGRGTGIQTARSPRTGRAARRLGNRAARSSRTGRAFPRKRPDDSRVTRAGSGLPGARAGRCWTWGAKRARSRLRSAGPWRFATAAAASLAVDCGSPMPITSVIGPMAGRRAWTTWSCCAGGITGRCTRRASGSRCRRVAGPTSTTRGAYPCRTHRRWRAFRGVRPTSLTAGTTWRRHSDIPWELEARAREALDPNG
jgi:hypothetical protein